MFSKSVRRTIRQSLIEKNFFFVKFFNSLRRSVKHGLFGSSFLLMHNVHASSMRLICSEQFMQMGVSGIFGPVYLTGESSER